MNTFQRTEQFPQLRVVMSEHKMEDNEIQRRLSSANRSFHACNKLLQSKLISHSTKIRICNTIIRSTLLYSSEHWIMNQNTKQCKQISLKIKYSEKYMVRHWKKTFGEESTTNREIRKLFGEQDSQGGQRQQIQMGWAHTEEKRE